MNFLAHLYYTQNLGYSALNTARCALSTVVYLNQQITFGQHPLVKRLLKGIFQERPSFPKYTKTWDVNIVFNYIKSMQNNESLSLRDLTFKVAILLKLLTLQRSQTLQKLKVTDIHIDDQSVHIYVSSLLKQSRPGNHLKPIKLNRFDDDKNICVVSALELYLLKTVAIRNDTDQLFISYLRPHKAVTVGTIAKWIKRMLSLSGVNVTTFGSHSTRAASASAVYNYGCGIETIMNAAGWSEAETFKRFYNLPFNCH